MAVVSHSSWHLVDAVCAACTVGGRPTTMQHNDGVIFFDSIFSTYVTASMHSSYTTLKHRRKNAWLCDGRPGNENGYNVVCVFDSEI